MKFASILLSLLAVALLSGCSTSYTEWHGGSVERGSGGAMKVVDGVEVWSYGAPSRAYRIVGLVEDSRPGAVIPMMKRMGSVVAAAHEAGADGVIIREESKEQVGAIHQMNGISSTSAYGNSNWRRTGPGRWRNNWQGTAVTSTSASGVSAPVMRAHGVYQVFKYVK